MTDAALALMMIGAWMAQGIFTGLWAEAKGRDGFVWGFLALCLPVINLIWLREAEQETHGATTPAAMDMTRLWVSPAQRREQALREWTEKNRRKRLRRNHGRGVAGSCGLLIVSIMLIATKTEQPTAAEGPPRVRTLADGGKMVLWDPEAKMQARTSEARGRGKAKREAGPGASHAGEQEATEEHAQRGALPEAGAWRTHRPPSAGKEWVIKRNTVESPRQRIGRTRAVAHLQVRCAGTGSVKVGLALDRALYPLRGREGTMIVRWNGADGEEQARQVRYWGKLIHIPAPEQEGMLDRLSKAKEVWLGLEGKKGENLIWATSLKGSRDAIRTARQSCAAGRGTFRDEPREKRATNRATGGGCSYGDVLAAWAYAQRAVKAEMRSPGSADFPFGGFRHLKYAGGCTWTGTSWVEGENAFGANVREHYTVTVTLLSKRQGQASVRWH